MMYGLGLSRSYGHLQASSPATQLPTKKEWSPAKASELKEDTSGKLIIALFAMLLAGCTSAPALQVRAAAASSFRGEPVSQFLAQMAKDGLLCQRRVQYEDDPRLKPFTDGTSKDVGFYECIAAKDGGLCVHAASTYMLSQYGKVIMVRGLTKSKNCLWN